MAKRRYAIRTKGLLLAYGVKNYLMEKKLLQNSNIEGFGALSNGSFITVPIGFIQSMRIAWALGIMEARFCGTAEMLKEVGA